jgi:hypothetical protein
VKQPRHFLSPGDAGFLRIRSAQTGSVHPFLFRNWEAYGLMPHQEVCGANAVTRTQGVNPCVSPCTFVPEVDNTFMICAIKDNVNLANVKPGLATDQKEPGDYMLLYTWFSTYFRAVLNARL